MQLGELYGALGLRMVSSVEKKLQLEKWYNIHDIIFIPRKKT